MYGKNEVREAGWIFEWYKGEDWFIDNDNVKAKGRVP